MNTDPDITKPSQRCENANAMIKAMVAMVTARALRMFALRLKYRLDVVNFIKCKNYI